MKIINKKQSAYSHDHIYAWTEVCMDLFIGKGIKYKHLLYQITHQICKILTA